MLGRTDKWGMARSRAAANLVLIFLLSLRCLLGSNLFCCVSPIRLGVQLFVPVQAKC